MLQIHSNNLILYLESKNQFIDMFQTWLPIVKAETTYLIKALKADRRGKSISIKINTYCQQYDIAIKYISLYLPKKKNPTKRQWETLVTIKVFLLMDKIFFNNF